MNKRQDCLFPESMDYCYPTTRYQGSKRKLLSQLRLAFSSLKFESALDLFSGSGSVSYLLRTLRKKVIANDYLLFNANTAKVFLSLITPSELEKCKTILGALLNQRPTRELSLVRDNYSNIFFTDEENKQIDWFCANLEEVALELRAALVYCVGQALLKKRPYNLFHRANLSMRLASVSRSFGNKKTWETSIEAHGLLALNELTHMHLHELPKGKSTHENTADLRKFSKAIDLIYLDPPYIPIKGSTIDYCDFYCFLDGLLDYSLFGGCDKQLTHRPLLKKESAWASPQRALDELSMICKNWPEAHLVFSYRGDSALPIESLVEVIGSQNRKVLVETLTPYKYALAHSRTSAEILLTSTPTLT